MPRSSDHSGLPPSDGGSSRRLRFTRRGVLSGAAALGLGAGLDRALGHPSAGPQAPLQDAIPFHGRHQAGIATPAPAHLHFAAFDLATSSRRAVRDLLERWSAAAAELTAGRPYADDPGEAVGLGPAQLTITFGLGPGMFDRDGLRLEALRPAGLAVLPPFAGERLDPARCGGDLCVQVCAADPQAAFHAVHVLARLAGEEATVRWTQQGFRPASAQGQTPRNLMGFKDGTNNIRGDDASALSRFVWVGSEGPSWLTGGTFLVVRRIDIVLDSWDAADLRVQEQTFGRHKLSGAPLGALHEDDPADLRALDPTGSLVIPVDAHIRVAGSEANQGTRILRRGYSFSAETSAAPLDRGGHQFAGGLFFIAYVRDPARFIALQRRLATGDALSAFTQHTGSAIFACPAGAPPGGFVGQGLLSS